MEIIFIVTTYILVLYTLLSLLYLRLKLSTGIGFATSSLLLLLSTVYVLLSKNYEFSWALLLLSIFIPILIPRVSISTPVRFLASILISFIRLGISKEKITQGRQEFADEMLDTLDVSEEKKEEMRSKLNDK